MLLGLRTVIYHVTDLEGAKRWYRDAFGIEPYFDQPFYVGFNVGGFELGLDPDVSTDKPGPGGSVAYWGVREIRRAMERMTSLGAPVHMPVRDVGEGILVAVVQDPFGNLVGLIENPHFVPV